MLNLPVRIPNDAGFTSINDARTDDGPYAMKSRKIAIVGGFAPRQCGIATFTTDVYESLKLVAPDVELDIYPMTPRDGELSFATPVRAPIVEHDPRSFADAARLIEASNPDIVWLQHEFGLFGGNGGDCILPLISAISAPLIVTFHTVLAAPDADQMRVMSRLVARASRIVIMSETSRQLMCDVYGASAEQLVVQPHGTPDRPFGRTSLFKSKIGLAGRHVLMTFGLLSPGKGIENVIRALPAVVCRHPDVVYCIVGATHPNLVAREGEAYRSSLIALANGLGVGDNLRWVDSFLSQDELLDQIEAADIYLTPYIGANQATSGTLAYAVALGKAVISTPYFHASELLADDHGVLIPFGDTAAFADAINMLLDDPDALLAMQQRAYFRGRSTIWPKIAADSLALVDDVVASESAKLLATKMPPVPSFDGIRRLSDDTGMLQHSIFSVPDRRHGYCVDDNARALMLMNYVRPAHSRDAEHFSGIYASFIQHAWNPDTQTFRNFMGFSRTWLEDRGSDDSNGRTLWALATTARYGRTSAMRFWAHRLYDQAAISVAQSHSPRTHAFAGLAADHILAIDPTDPVAHAAATRTGEFLLQCLAGASHDDWHWFEASLAYDNCRLSEALIRIGDRIGRPDMVTCGLATLGWITAKQTGASGLFRPIGSDGFGVDGATLPFDQQPVEVWAMIDAADAAFDVTTDIRWVHTARTAYNWFYGANDRGVVLGNHVLGTCRDGIIPRGENLNEGAESTLAFHLGYVTLRALLEKAGPDAKDIASMGTHIG